jgi:hypothetical protein
LKLAASKPLIEAKSNRQILDFCNGAQDDDVERTVIIERELVAITVGKPVA